MNDADQKKLDEILLWIINHNKNTEAMDKIAYAAYPYSTKYKTRYGADGESAISSHD